METDPLSTMNLGEFSVNHDHINFERQKQSEIFNFDQYSLFIFSAVHYDALGNEKNFI